MDFPVSGVLLRQLLFLRVDNPQHTLTFATNAGGIQTLMFFIEHHFAHVGLTFRARKLQGFHLFIAADIQQRDGAIQRITQPQSVVALIQRDRERAALGGDPPVNLQRVGCQQEQFPGRFIFAERGRRRRVQGLLSGVIRQLINPVAELPGGELLFGERLGKERSCLKCQRNRERTEGLFF